MIVKCCRKENLYSQTVKIFQFQLNYQAARGLDKRIESRKRSILIENLILRAVCFLQFFHFSLLNGSKWPIFGINNFLHSISIYFQLKQKTGQKSWKHQLDFLYFSWNNFNIHISIRKYCPDSRRRLLQKCQLNSVFQTILIHMAEMVYEHLISFSRYIFKKYIVFTEL